MTPDEIKQIMLFHLLTHDGNLSMYKFIALDRRGVLYAYTDEPVIKLEEAPDVWLTISGCMRKITRMNIESEHWKESLMEI